MKHFTRLLFFIVCVLCFIPGFSQKADCERYIKDAAAAEKRGDYRSALLLYSGALVCDPSQKSLVDQRILAVFDKIDGQKKDAIQSRKELDVAKQEVEAERDRAIAAGIEARRQAILAENTSMASQNVALALQTISTDPTLALRLAGANREFFPGNSASQAIYYKILGDTSLHFYKENLEFNTKVMCLAISPDGTKMCAGLANGAIALWNPTDRAPRPQYIQAHSSKEVRCVKFSTNGLLLSIGADKKVKIWDFSAGISAAGVVRVIDTKPDAIVAAAFSSDGKEMLFGFENGKIQNRLTTTPDSILSEFNYINIPTTVAFSPDGMYVLAAGNDDLTWIWHKSKSLKPFKILSGHTADVRSVAFSADGQWLLTASRDRTARLWDWKNSDESIRVFEGHTDGLTYATFLPDGKTILTGSDDNTLKIWHRDASAVPLATCKGHRSSVRDVALEASGLEFWSAGQDSTVKSWSLRPRPSAAVSSNLHKNRVVALQADSQSGKIFSAGADGKIVCWNTRDTTAEVFEVAAHDGTLLDIAVSPGGTDVVSSGKDSLVKLWSFSELGGRLRRTWPKFGAEASLLAMSPNGRLLAAAVADSSVWIWDLAQEKEPPIRLSGFQGLATSLAFSPGSNLLAVGSEDNIARVWELGTDMAPRLRQTLRGHAGRVTNLFFMQEGKSLLTGSADAKIRDWNLEAVELPEKTAVFAKRIYSDKVMMAVSADKSHIAVTQDNILKIWAYTGVEKPFWGQFGTKINVTALAFDPSGHQIWVGFADGHTEGWATPDFFVTQQVAKIPLSNLIMAGLQIRFDSFFVSQDAQLLATVGSALYRQGDFQPARSFWEKAVRLNPIPENQVGLYKSERRLNIDRVESILASDSIRVLEAFSKFFFEAGDWEQACRFYEKMYRLNPRDIQVLVSWFDAALRGVQPFDLGLFLNLNETTQYDRAMYYLNNALNLHSRRSTFDQRIAQYSTLLKIFDQALRRDSTHFSADIRLFSAATWCTNLADLYANRGDFPRAMQYLDRAELYDPTWRNIYVLKPILLIRTNRFEEAAAFYQKKGPEEYQPKKGIPKYRDQFLQDLQVWENSGELSLLQLEKVIEFKKLLKELP